jgi:hypothetical protein
MPNAATAAPEKLAREPSRHCMTDDETQKGKPR